MPHNKANATGSKKEKRPARYEVGYGRPPKETRFEEGISGNPKGRPKGSISVAATLGRILKARVIVVEKGRKKSINKFEAAMMQLARLAINGDMNAMRQIISVVALMEQRAENNEPKEKPLGRTEKKMLQNMIKRFEGTGKGKQND